MVCCSMASRIHALSWFFIVLNSSIQHIPSSARTNAPASSVQPGPSWIDSFTRSSSITFVNNVLEQPSRSDQHWLIPHRSSAPLSASSSPHISKRMIYQFLRKEKLIPWWSSSKISYQDRRRVGDAVGYVLWFHAVRLRTRTSGLEKIEGYSLFVTYCHSTR